MIYQFVFEAEVIFTPFLRNSIFFETVQLDETVLWKCVQFYGIRVYRWIKEYLKSKGLTTAVLLGKFFCHRLDVLLYLFFASNGQYSNQPMEQSLNIATGQ